MKKRIGTLVLWIALIAIFLLLFNLVSDDEPSYQVDFEGFLSHVDEERVGAVRVDGNEVIVTLWETGEVYSTLGVVDDDLVRRLSDQGVVVAWGAGEGNRFGSVATIGVLLLVLALFIYFLRRARGDSTNILSMRKSRARRLAEPGGVTFDDVGGAVAAKERLGDVIDFLKNPDRWSAAGVRLPRGVLLEGPPGCGKTLLARAVAGEAGVPFFLVSASEFVEMFVGVGAARVRDMFETALKQAPSVIFIDELDAVGRRRGSGIGAGHDEREQTLNQLLVCLDGFEQNDRVVVLAASNRVDVLDQALLRPGRFDCRIAVPPLGREERVETLGIHTRGKKLAEDVCLEEIAEATDGMTGADLEALANEAARLALHRPHGADEGVPAVRMEEFRAALAPKEEERARFNAVDSVLIESASQLVQPTARAVVRLVLRDDTAVEGELVWADASFLKVRDTASGTERVVAKSQVRGVEALAGTQSVAAGEVVPDAWARHLPDLA